MVLVGYSWVDVAVWMLWGSLIIIVLVIGYRQLLRYLSRGTIDKADYCELYSLEESPAVGELPFYFTSSKVKQYTLEILDAKMNPFKEVVTQDCKEGGNIVRFDSTLLPNGEYFYCLRTDNQKIVKKMTVRNG